MLAMTINAAAAAGCRFAIVVTPRGRAAGGPPSPHADPDEAWPTPSALWKTLTQASVRCSSGRWAAPSRPDVKEIARVVASGTVRGRTDLVRLVLRWRRRGAGVIGDQASHPPRSRRGTMTVEPATLARPPDVDPPARFVPTGRIPGEPGRVRLRRGGVVRHGRGGRPPLRHRTDGAAAAGPLALQRDGHGGAGARRQRGPGLDLHVDLPDASPATGGPPCARRRPCSTAS